MVTAASIGRILTQCVPDAVHIATEGPLDWTTRRACRQLGLKFITSYHTCFSEYVRLRAPMPMALSYALIRSFHQVAERTMPAPTIIEDLDSKNFSNLVP